MKMPIVGNLGRRVELKLYSELTHHDKIRVKKNNEFPDLTS
jgi:hypothetical protein